jgi:hypothetical protein
VPQPANARHFGRGYWFFDNAFRYARNQSPFKRAQFPTNGRQSGTRHALIDIHINLVGILFGNLNATYIHVLTEFEECSKVWQTKGFSEPLASHVGWARSTPPKDLFERYQAHQAKQRDRHVFAQLFAFYL